MTDHRTGKGFPDPRVPGDARLLDAIQRRTPQSTGEVINVPGGRILTSGAPRARAVASGNLAFHRVFKDGSDWKLQGGQVTGGTGNVVVADITLAVVASEPADGVKQWLEITGNGVTDSGVLLGGFNVTAAVSAVPGQQGATVPNNTLPEYDDATGKKAYLLLGTWSGSQFVAAQGGNVTVSFCPGNFTITRGS